MVTPREEAVIKLVLGQVDQTWGEVRATATGERGPAPSAFIVNQFAAARWDRAECDGSLVRQWVRDESGTAERPPSPAELAAVSVRHRMCNEVGEVSFHISAGLDRVVYTYVVGLRFGRGMILRVSGYQLELDAMSQWVS